jgi:hypothetical protein
MQIAHGFRGGMTHRAVFQAYDQIALVVTCFGQDLLIEWYDCLVPCRVRISTFQEPVVDLAACAIIESLQTALHVGIVL